jgi:hypothetical protein
MHEDSPFVKALICIIPESTKYLVPYQIDPLTEERLKGEIDIAITDFGFDYNWK